MKKHGQAQFLFSGLALSALSDAGEISPFETEL
jgi:hypothetical protein